MLAEGADVIVSWPGVGLESVVDGFGVGNFVGSLLGKRVGCIVAGDPATLGTPLGPGLGDPEGRCVGALLGKAVGGGVSILQTPHIIGHLFRLKAS